MRSFTLFSLLFLVACNEGTGGGSTDSETDTDTDADSDTDTDADVDYVKGDLNGDGVIDPVISYVDDNTYEGTVHVFDGAADLTTVTYDDALLTHEDWLAGISSATCDLDGDGTADLLVGHGDEVFVWFGGPDLGTKTDRDLRIYGADYIADDRMMDCGDFTGNGVDDLVAGYSGSGATGVFVLPGGSELHDQNGTVDLDQYERTIDIAADGYGDAFGRHVFLFDLDDDGVCDLLAGAEGVDAGAENGRGQVEVFFGGSDRTPGTSLPREDADFTAGGPDDQNLFPANIYYGPTTDGLAVLACGEPCVGGHIEIGTTAETTMLRAHDGSVGITGHGFQLTYDEWDAVCLLDDEDGMDVAVGSLEVNDSDLVVCDPGSNRIPTWAAFQGRTTDKIVVGGDSNVYLLDPDSLEIETLTNLAVGEDDVWNFGPRLGCP